MNNLEREKQDAFDNEAPSVERMKIYFVYYLLSWSRLLIDIDYLHVINFLTLFVIYVGSGKSLVSLLVSLYRPLGAYSILIVCFGLPFWHPSFFFYEVIFWFSYPQEKKKKCNNNL